MSNIWLLPPPAFEDDGFGDMHSDLNDEIDSLRCVEAIMKASSPLGAELDAPMGLLIRTVKRIDELHTTLDEWHVRRFARRAALWAAKLG